ncbi:MAG: pyridoxal-phosphate dependent enzyme [Candidatus Acidiferrales bacterium]
MSSAAANYLSADAIVRPTTIIEATRLDSYLGRLGHLGVKIVLASETFQQTGSFKFRAAYNVVINVPQTLFITASSGNFGQALAYACALTGKSCIVVMPSTSSQIKIAAVRAYGGRVELIDTRMITRKKRVRQLADENPDAYLATPFDDPLVIEGNSGLGSEIAALNRGIQEVVAPLGGGGLASGLIVGLRRAGSAIPVVAAEPLLANDGARSLREGRIVANEYESETIADGARTLSVGVHNWKILQHGLEGIIEVAEDKIAEALRLLFVHANLKVEPTAALSLGAVLTAPEKFKDKTVCCVVSGGNVDPSTYAKLLVAQPQPARTP